MKQKPILLLVILLATIFHSYGQGPEKYRIQLISGTIDPSPNISAGKVKDLNRGLSRFAGKGQVFIQFFAAPDQVQREQLRVAGIELGDYVSGNAWLAITKGEPSAETLKRLGVRALVPVEPQHKIQPALLRSQPPAHAQRGEGQLEVWISLSASFVANDIKAELAKLGFSPTEERYQAYRVLGLQVAKDRLNRLAALPFVEFVQAAPAPDQALNDKSRANARANVLQSNGPGGYNLSGNGVVLGVGDDGTPVQHIDLIRRAYNHSFATAGPHGVHVMGTMTGAGIRDERYMGYAPASNFVAQVFSNILLYTPQYIADYGMVLTNNSYGNVVDDCESFGMYDLYSRVVDMQQNQYGFLMHVFAAGNSGTLVCNGYTPGFGNVLGGFQSAKNSISVGNTWEYGELAASSSKGPVKDGRIKPEIAAQGTRVFSTVTGNNYNRNNGTSMAAPAVTGGLALLYEQYKKQNGGANPDAALMKALLCNGATDLGNPGPDYTYGFGWMNLWRSVRMLEEENYFSGSVSQAQTVSHSIQIPAGATIASLKLMLHWNDPAALPLATQSLINDLDLVVRKPDGSTVLPFVLQGSGTQVTQAATRGADHVNNLEQVLIENPMPGNYTVEITGFQLNAGGNQSYVVVFDTISAGHAITYPFGGERFSDSDSLYISWESQGLGSGNQSLEYTIDNGVNWITIASNLSPTARQHLWHIPPGTLSTEARIRLSQNGNQTTSEVFTILGVPVVTLAPVQCDTYIAINWSAVANADNYEVLVSTGEAMRSMGFTTGTSYTMGGLSRDSNYFVGVRAWKDGKPGRRALAVSRTPSTGTCAGVISNGDLRVLSISSPVTGGRLETSRVLSAATIIRFFVRNIDDQSFLGDIPVGYQVNNNPAVRDTIRNMSLGANGTISYAFAVPADLSAPGEYVIKAWIDQPADPVAGNDTAQVQVRQVENPVVDLSNPFLEDFEAGPLFVNSTRQVGLPGLDRFDFIGSTNLARIRNRVTGVTAKSGERALTLDVSQYAGAGNIDSLTATFNLKNYQAANADIRLDFQYKHHGQLPHPANQLWVRGNDQSPWLPAYDLDDNQAEPGVFRKTPSLEISDLLLANGQEFSSSFQAKWGQWGRFNTTDQKSAAGYTFDDIRLYTVVNDIQLISIDTPIVASCGLDAQVPVRITVRNSANDPIGSIPVSYRVNGQAVVTETIASIPGNSSVDYSFIQRANLSTLGTYQLDAWVSFPGDNFRDNDSASTQIRNSPVITSFPYLQDFETGESFWFASGNNSSWEWGTPASAKIRTAASGQRAWKTSLVGNYNDGELSYLYSPCFDLSGMSQPMLSFSSALDIEDCGASTLCDGAWVEYSIDGKTWQRLGAFGDGMNWYNRNYGSGPVWSIQNYTYWHAASIPLPANHANLRIRFVMSSDPYVSREGVAIDDIHIYDLAEGIFNDAVDSSNKVEQVPVANEWIRYSDNGQLLADLYAGNNNLGNVSVQVYRFNGPVRDTNQAYYLNRNLVIQTEASKLEDSAIVRFYFTDAEVEAWRAANGCAECPQPVSAYQLGVAAYADADPAIENGTIDDNSGTRWEWLPREVVRIVPFERGYYAEFKRSRFSEFWLSAARLDNMPPASLVFSQFTARRSGTNDVVLDWRTQSEFNVEDFEVELARGNDAYNQQDFEVIGSQVSQGNTTTGHSYTFTDTEPGKSGVRYYRIKGRTYMGDTVYTEARAVVFDSDLNWQIYPNPSSGNAWLMFQVNEGEKVQAVVYDMQGRRLLQREFTGTGFVQKQEFDLSSIAARGLYLVELFSGGEKRRFKLLRQ